MVVTAPAGSCPVSLHAQHKADGAMMQAGIAHAVGIGQLLHLVLEDSSGAIAKATVTIHGYSNKARIAKTSGNGVYDVESTVTVDFSSVSPHAAAGDAWAAGMTAVTRLDLNSVSYADGTTQAFTAQQACHVAPDPFMLVAAR
jgi:hypothetical protein